MSAAADFSPSVRRDAPKGAALATYAAFGLPVTMTALPINILLPDFYAANTALPLATIGIVLLATRLVDALADPLLGSWVDAQKQTGSYLRPIMFASIPLAAGFVAVFSPQWAASAGRATTTTWLALTLIAAYLGYSLATIAYQAWGAELAHDDAGRTRITAGP